MLRELSASLYTNSWLVRQSFLLLLDHGAEFLNESDDR